MTCTVHHTVGANGGHTVAKGDRPRKPCRWEVSVFFVLPNGEKHTHAVTVPCATLRDMIPLMNLQFDELAAEHGQGVTGAGWIAHGRGVPKKRKRK